MSHEIFIKRVMRIFRKRVVRTSMAEPSFKPEHRTNRDEQTLYELHAKPRSREALAESSSFFLRLCAFA